MAAFFFQQEIILGLIADEQQNFLRQQGVGLGRALQPGTVLAAPAQVVFQHLPVQHKGDGGVGVLCLHLQVGKAGGFLFRPQRHREGAVRFNDGVGDLARVEDVLAAQCFHQVSGGEPQHPQGVLVDLPV